MVWATQGKKNRFRPIRIAWENLKKIIARKPKFSLTWHFNWIKRENMIYK